MTGRPNASDRLLIVRLGAIGDVTNALSSRRCAAHPGCFIGWAVHPLGAPLVEAPTVDRVHVWPRRTGIPSSRCGASSSRRATTRDRPPGLQKSLSSRGCRSAPRPRLDRGARRAELDLDARAGRDRPAPQHGAPVHASRALGLRKDPAPPPAPRRGSVRGRLREGTWCAVAQLGASRRTSCGRPRSSGSSQLASSRPRWFDGPLVLTGGPGTAPRTRSSRPRRARPRRTHELPELWALCARSHAMVSADTGPMHLCAAVGSRPSRSSDPGIRPDGALRRTASCWSRDALAMEGDRSPSMKTRQRRWPRRPRAPFGRRSSGSSAPRARSSESPENATDEVDAPADLPALGNSEVNRRCSVRQTCLGETHETAQTPRDLDRAQLTGATWSTALDAGHGTPPPPPPACTSTPFSSPSWSAPASPRFGDTLDGVPTEVRDALVREEPPTSGAVAAPRSSGATPARGLGP